MSRVPRESPDAKLQRAERVAVARDHDGPVERGFGRVLGWAEVHPTASRAIALALILVAFVPGVVLLFVDVTEQLRGLGLASVFLTNLISTATLFVPVPGVTAAANLLIVSEGERSSYPWLVGIVGGVGMALGEFTAYYAGVAGSMAARSDLIDVPQRIKPLATRIWSVVERITQRWGFITLFVLAAIPEPFFEIAAVTAAASGMTLKRFFTAVLAGCIIRGFTLAYLGDQFGWFW